MIFKKKSTKLFSHFFFSQNSIICLQEQYKTIFLTLHEMFKAPVGVQTANEYLLKSQSAKPNHHAYVSSLRKEFQVGEYAYLLYCKKKKNNMNFFDKQS